MAISFSSVAAAPAGSIEKSGKLGMDATIAGLLTRERTGAMTMFDPAIFAFFLPRKKLSRFLYLR
jgi:hypothetical protein